MAFTQAAKRLMLRALMDAVVEAGWGTSGAATAGSLTNPVYTSLVDKRLEGDGVVFEYALAWEGLGVRTLREIALFTRDENGNRVMLYRRTRGPVDLEVGMTVIDRLTVRLEEV
jgi:hypothetical protein